MTTQLGQSAKNIDKDFDPNGLHSLLDTVGKTAEQNATKLQEAAKLRALANGPFVTGSPIKLPGVGGLGTIGAILGGGAGAVVGKGLEMAGQLATDSTARMRALSLAEGLVMKTSKKIQKRRLVIPSQGRRGSERPVSSLLAPSSPMKRQNR